jgi:hypothetical protein
LKLSAQGKPRNMKTFCFGVNSSRRCTEDQSNICYGAKEQNYECEYKYTGHKSKTEQCREFKGHEETKTIEIKKY